jgi:hypothetical protein
MRRESIPNPKAQDKKDAVDTIVRQADKGNREHEKPVIRPELLPGIQFRGKVLTMVKPICDGNRGGSQV